METITRIELRGGGRRNREWLGSHLNTKTHCNGDFFVFKGKNERWEGNVGSRYENAPHKGHIFVSAWGKESGGAPGVDV